MNSSRISFNSLCLFVLIVCLINACVSAVDVSHDARAITIDGERRIIFSGAIHYPRSTSEMWPDLIKKAKAGGLDAIETYVFWNAHEPVRRQYDFDGNLDLIRFIKTVQDEGLYLILRIGPYVCAEWNYGGFPVWLHNIPGIELRTSNDVYMNEMQNFTTKIVDMVKQENLFASQGGPIILAQIENEYGNVMGPYGAAGEAYINWCAKMADSFHIGVPWIMCQQPNAPKPMLETCNGFYCDEYTPSDPNTPKIWTENWVGWFKAWGNKHPTRPTEDVAYAVARFFQSGGTLNNYYMYHGGTNFGRTAGGPYITTTYDYDAPLNEYGVLNQPKYGHLKNLHDVLHSIEKTLTYGDVSSVEFGKSVNVTIYSYNGNSSCFISNTNTTSDATVNYKGVDYIVPAWSVSILPDCKKEAYNTAKVNTQTSVMVKKANEAENEPIALEWAWKQEEIDRLALLENGRVSAAALLDQKAMNDSSDYLWYMTSVDLKDDVVWSQDMSIRVNGSGQILHAYVNGKYVGSKWGRYDGNDFLYEQNASFKQGKNEITLLSATVGFKNYGARFDMSGDGLPGPIQIIGRRGDDETVVKDLSKHQWTYKTGLKGLEDGLFDYNVESTVKWQTVDLPINKSMTWYKASFKAPLGEEPVVVDLLGLGKGMAWVNGHSLGRYWPAYIADGDCDSSQPCNYRGKYESKKCVSGCGEPTQRWYHVPRSFVHEDVNELVLFEEFGGNPTLVNLATDVVGSVCGSAYENNTMEISCGGSAISSVKFASFGDSPHGSCGQFRKGSCNSKLDALSILQECVGKESCTISASEGVFGSTDCEEGIMKRLVVEAVC